MFWRILYLGYLNKIAVITCVIPEFATREVIKGSTDESFKSNSIFYVVLFGK